MQREHHLLQIPEIPETEFERNDADQQAACFVIEKHGRHIAVLLHRLRWSTENKQRIGSCFDLLVRSELEEIGQRTAEFQKGLMKIRENRQRPDLRRVAEKLRWIESERSQRISVDAKKFTGPLVHWRIDDQRRNDQYLADKRDPAQASPIRFRKVG